MPERMPERTFELGNPEGRGRSCSFGIPDERRVKKCAFHHGGVDFFWNNSMQTYSVLVDSFKRGVMNVDHLRGHQDHMLIFFVIFNSILTCHLSGQGAFFVGSLTQDPSLICITGCTCIYVIASLHLLHFTF